MIDVAKVAQAAHIMLTPLETAEFTRQLALVADYVARLREVDISGVELTPPPATTMAALRNDEPHGSPVAGTLLAAAPATLGGEVCVPRIIDA